MMNLSVIRSLFLGTLLLVFISPALSLPSTRDSEISIAEMIFNVTINAIDDVEESIQSMNLKCLLQNDSHILSCHIDNYVYNNNCLMSPCVTSNNLENLKVNPPGDPFEIKFCHSNNGQKLTVSATTSPMHINFYRTIASHMTSGIDLTDKPEGTYSMIEDSVYGKCEVLVKFVDFHLKDDVPKNKMIMKLLPSSIDNINGSSVNSLKDGMISIKKTRNLETCHPVPGLVIFGNSFRHPMMTSVHWDIKSSISRMIMSHRSFTSYTTEDIAVKNLEIGNNVTMLHLRTTLTVHSIKFVETPIPRISDPLSVQLPFVDAIDGSGKPNAQCE